MFKKYAIKVKSTRPEVDRRRSYKVEFYVRSAEVKPWVLHFHTSAGYGETIIRFRTRAEARKYRDDLSWVKELVFYPIYKEKNEREESKGRSGGTHAERL